MSTLANLYNDLKTLCSQWFYTKAEIDTNKQDKLVSGSNIKTVNNNSLLGSGNISISGGGGGSDNIWELEQTNMSTGVVAFDDFEDEDHYGIFDKIYYSRTDDAVYYNDYTDADCEIATKGDIPVTNTWQTKTLNNATSYATLYVNEAIKMCFFRYSRAFSSITANNSYSWHTGTIPSAYRPPVNVVGTFNYGGSLIIGTDGNIGAYFTYSNSTNRTYYATAMWRY